MNLNENSTQVGSATAEVINKKAGRPRNLTALRTMVINDDYTFRTKGKPKADAKFREVTFLKYLDGQLQQYVKGVTKLETDVPYVPEQKSVPVGVVNRPSEPVQSHTLEVTATQVSDSVLTA